MTGLTRARLSWKAKYVAILTNCAVDTLGHLISTRVLVEGVGLAGVVDLELGALANVVIDVQGVA